MAYTVTKLAKLSGVSVRTLHWYDEVGLLKPAYHGANGYRYYEEEQLLCLQQILFFRELGFELKRIQHILGRSDFDKMVALRSHQQVLKKNLERTKKLIKTIDHTIQHLEGRKKMKEQEFYHGFDKEKQKEYERQLIERFGDKVKKSFAECEQNVKNWTKADWDKSSQKFDVICKLLASLIEKQCKTDSNDVQAVVRSHYEWLKQFWTPTKETYISHGRHMIVGSDLRKAYEAYHPHMPEYLADAIEIFSKNELT
jgi:MerR family transcriptional regulator, thiopeptide resistance regulator